MTEHKLRVALLYCGGMKRSDVAKNLYTQDSTVRNHLSKVYRHFGITGGSKRILLLITLASYGYLPEVFKIARFIESGRDDLAVSLVWATDMNRNGLMDSEPKEGVVA